MACVTQAVMSIDFQYQTADNLLCLPSPKWDVFGRDGLFIFLSVRRIIHKIVSGLASTIYKDVSRAKEQSIIFWG